jgi:hypothetical protein
LGHGVKSVVGKKGEKRIEPKRKTQGVKKKNLRRGLINSNAAILSPCGQMIG